MADQVAKMRKPQLRGLLQSQIKYNLGVGTVLAVIAGAAHWWYICEGNKRRTMEFYRNYDIEKAFNEIRNKGLLESCEPDQ